jgi:hypothetical protein
LIVIRAIPYFHSIAPRPLREIISSQQRKHSHSGNGFNSSAAQPGYALQAYRDSESLTD